jgi:hypothetical protein
MIGARNMNERRSESGSGALINHVHPGNTSKNKKELLLLWFSDTLHTGRSEQIIHRPPPLAGPLDALLTYVRS